jgi:hypothetical protein
LKRLASWGSNQPQSLHHHRNTPIHELPPRRLRRRRRDHFSLLNPRAWVTVQFFRGRGYGRGWGRGWHFRRWVGERQFSEQLWAVWHWDMEPRFVERRKGKSWGWECGYVNLGIGMRLAMLNGPGFDWHCIRFYPQ